MREAEQMSEDLEPLYIEIVDVPKAQIEAYRAHGFAVSLASVNPNIATVSMRKPIPAIDWMACPGTPPQEPTQ